MSAVRDYLKKPFQALDLILASALYCGFIAWFFMDRTITFFDGGFRVPLIKFSWFLGLLLLNNALWLVLALYKKWRQRHFSASQSPVSIGIFVFSHVLLAAVLMSDIVHYLLFGEHWNSTTISTAYYGILVGSAPLGLNYPQIGLFIVMAAVAFWFMAFAIKLIPRPRSLMQWFSPLLISCVLLTLLSSLTLLQRSMPSNWHSQQIQALIPFFQFVQRPIAYPKLNQQLQAYTAIKEKQLDLLQTLDQQAKIESASITAKRRPNILLVHVEALRSDLFSPEHLPNLWAFKERGAEHLAHHYSSSNNTVGSIFGMLSGLAGPLYQLQREEQNKLSSMNLLQHLGYKLSLFTSSPMSYQNALSTVFKGFENHEFYGRGNLIEDKAMLDAYIAATAVADAQPRMDYLILNSTHFPYSYPDDLEKFLPVVDRVGLSYSASSREYLERNKEGLRNRFYNSALYMDALLGELITALEARDYFANGILVVVGDHGQEFWEHNRFGHSWSLVDEQTQVVALIKAPEVIASQYRYTSHSDFMPSIFSIMGVEADVLASFTGKSLLNYKAENDFVSIGIGVMGTQKPSRAAVIADGMKVVYSYEPSLSIEKIKDDNDNVIVIDSKKSQAAVEWVKHALGSMTVPAYSL